MRIGLDISQIVYSGTGVSRYTQGLVEAILKFDDSHRWVFFFSGLRQKLPKKLESGILKKGFILKKYSIPPTALSLLWNKFHLLDVKHLVGNLDWFISSDWAEPPSNHIKKATIIHDLVYLKYPETVNWKILKTQQQRLVHVCSESDLIIADSDSTKKDIQQLLPVKKAKIQTIYPGVETILPSKTSIQKTLSRFNLRSNRFILAVGKREPRKNLERLIKAYNDLDFSSHSYQPPLIIVGPRGWGSLELVGKDVRVINYVSDEELYGLYHSCLFFVFPSLYEGFGYPLLEAASFGCAMTVSNTSSLQELGKDISLLFNPEHIGDMTKQMQKLLNDKSLRQELGKKAKIKASEFAWQNTLNNLLETLEAI